MRTTWTRQLGVSQISPIPTICFLDFWLRLGIVGLVFVSGFLVRFFLFTHRIAYAQRYERRCAHLGIGLAGSQLAAVTHGMLDNYYFLPDLASWFWLTAAMCGTRLCLHDPRT